MLRALLRIVTHHTKEGETASIVEMLYVGITSQIFDVCATQEYPFTYCGGNISTVCPDCANEAESDLPEGFNRASLHGFCIECDEVFELCSCDR